ncbi:uncharacterized, partial [Tachysurus ichikawai]
MWCTSSAQKLRKKKLLLLLKSELSDVYPCGDGCGVQSDSAFDLQEFGEQ